MMRSSRSSRRAASRRHRSRRRSWRGCRFVLYEPGGNARRVIDDWFRSAGVSLKPVMELGNIEAMKPLIAAGLGCGLLPRLAVAGDGASGLTVRSLSPLLHRRIGLVLRRDKTPDRALREVITALRRLGRD